MLYNREMIPIILGASSAVAAGGLTAWAAMSPRSQLFGATIYCGADDRQIALTYDDGPNQRETPKLLELLAAHSAKATFFVIGKYVRQQPGIVREIVAQGHTLGNHTFDHPSLFWTSPGRVREQLERCQKEIEDATGKTPAFFRPPFGARRPDVLRTARELGLTPVMWTATCYDWKENAPEAVMKHAARDIETKGFGSIVLLHDGGHLAMNTDRGHTVSATKMLLERYQPQGYEFAGVAGLKR